MIECDVYELLAFLANLNKKEDFTVTAKTINQIDNELRVFGIRCDFSKQSLEAAAMEYPQRFEVLEQTLIIKVHSKSCSRFIYYNSKNEVVEKLTETWQKIIKEF